jgi:hypothetical protein
MTLNQIADDLQAECHKVTKHVLLNTEGSTYQDAVNTWMYRKLAELILANNKLEKRILFLEQDLRQRDYLKGFDFKG